MPIPSPESGESESTFVSRCIAAISGEYEQDQAAAICYRQFRESKSMNKNSQLIEKIKARSGSGEFGYGITTADRYVSEAVKSLGNPMLVKHFHCMGSNAVDNLLKRAANTLTICCPETDMDKSAALIKESQEQQATSLKAMAKILGCDPPPHAMMAIVNRLTTPREDRDGDTLQTAGANMDPKAPLLWQHIHTLPIGKMMRVVSQDKDCLKVATVLLDINELTSDAGKLFEAGALRFSHGFIAKEFEERKGGGDMARFNILKFDIVEESAVSVPSNVDAEVELFCRGKLASDVMKAHAKSLFDIRKKSMAVTDKAKKIFGTGEKALAAASVKVTTKMIRKHFDVASERLKPCSMQEEWASRYIGCAVKDLHVHSTGANGMMVGPFLCGLEHATSKYKITDTRNFDGNGNNERPPIYETLDVKSDCRKNFLVEGMRFGAGSGSKVTWQLEKCWGSQQVLVYAEHCDEAQKVIDDAWEWVAMNNPLKGQAFALTGGWLSKTGVSWGDVFLEESIEKSLKRTVRIINNKGADAANRGVILSGPPGTGKTLSARVMLNEADCTYIWVSAKDFWQVGAFEAFSGTLSLARSLAPSIVCFEDVDNWIDPWTVDLLKGEMDGLQQSSGVVTILTTNFPDKIPSALIDRPGRFHDVLEIHLPSKDVRLRMLQKWASGATLDSLDSMAKETDGYSGAHVYELCNFAKTIQDEDECSLEDALTKAFTKVKEQRDLINQNQLAGSSYRPGRRELTAMLAKGWKGNSMHGTKLDSPVGDMTMGGPVPNDGESRETFMGRCMLDSVMMDQYPTEANREQACSIQFGKSAKPTVKDMGKCKECGAKADLNKDGMCADCAKKESEPDEDDSMPKSGKPSGEKAGRVLSARNYGVLEDAAADLDTQLKIMELPREAKALGESAHRKVKNVLSSATPVADPQPSGNDHVLRDAIMLAGSDRSARDMMRKAIETFDKADENEQLAEDFRKLQASVLTG